MLKSEGRSLVGVIFIFVLFLPAASQIPRVGQMKNQSLLLTYHDIKYTRSGREPVRQDEGNPGNGTSRV
jgi:hypothetical protein